MDPRLQPGRQHQRFSWQNPSPPVDVSLAGGAPSLQQPQQQAPQQQQYQQYQQQQQRAPQQPQQQQQYQQYQQNQQNSQNQQPVTRNDRGLSYAQTPIEYRGYALSPIEPPLPTSALTPIDPRPQSVFNTQALASQPQPPSYLSATYPHEKEPPSPLSPHLSTHPAHFSPVSPMIGVPLIQTQQPPQHIRQRSNLSPINTNVGQYSMPPMPPTPHSYQTETASALPSKTPITPISPGPIKKDPADHLSPNVRTSYPAEPYSPHGLTSQTRHGTVFSPDSAHGPNGLDFALHQPGQIAHPNMDLSGKGSSHEWKHSLCECGDLSTCLTGLFCPCILYGRTSYRLSQRSAKKDPTDMLSYKTTNKHCIVMGAACGLWGLFPMLQRTRIRHMYKLEGSVCGDALRGCCCCCCTAIQNEREFKEREENSRRFAGPSDVYGKKEVMSYTPQR